MDLKSFIKQNRKDWESLELILKKISKKKNLTPELLESFQMLYQKSSYHLSFCQTYYPNEDITTYLNELVAKSHNLLYRNQVTSLNQLKKFFSSTFVYLFIEQKKFILVAFLLFALGTAGGFISVMNDPLHLYSILPSEIADGINPEELGNYDEPIDSPSMSAMIMTNNIKVAFLAFVGGITLGILTIYILVANGILLGALAALFLQHGMFYDFWAYIVPHGMLELTAIFIAGGSGLLMGYRIIVPDNYPRNFQIKYQAFRSVQLLLGTIPLFVIAAIIEGYFTPAPISLEIKYIFSILTLICFIFYIKYFSTRSAG